MISNMDSGNEGGSAVLIPTEGILHMSTVKAKFSGTLTNGFCLMRLRCLDMLRRGFYGDPLFMQVRGRRLVASVIEGR